MARKSPTPTLAPVRACFPTASVEVPNEALPLTSVAVASTVAPSLNVTVPVGTPVPGATGLTTAVSVTAWPITEGFGGAVRLVDVGGWTTFLTTTVADGLGSPMLPPEAAVLGFAAGKR